MEVHDEPIYIPLPDYADAHAYIADKRRELTESLGSQLSFVTMVVKTFQIFANTLFDPAVDFILASQAEVVNGALDLIGFGEHFNIDRSCKLIVK